AATAPPDDDAAAGPSAPSPTEDAGASAPTSAADAASAQPTSGEVATDGFRATFPRAPEAKKLGPSVRGWRAEEAPGRMFTVTLIDNPEEDGGMLLPNPVLTFVQLRDGLVDAASGPVEAEGAAVIDGRPGFELAIGGARPQRARFVLAGRRTYAAMTAWDATDEGGRDAAEAFMRGFLVTDDAPAAIPVVWERREAEGVSVETPAPLKVKRGDGFVAVGAKLPMPAQECSVVRVPYTEALAADAALALARTTVDESVRGDFVRAPRVEVARKALGGIEMEVRRYVGTFIPRAGGGEGEVTATLGKGERAAFALLGLTRAGGGELVTRCLESFHEVGGEEKAP
ncbi:MAG: hypothetical protein KC635_05975, partial [Myxococcales bacterium]|nr:hypothetical protein [Myxococcales bacterium]